MVRKLLVALVVLFAALGGAVMTGWTAMGTRASGDRLDRMEASPQWQDSSFANTLPREDPKFGPMLSAWRNKSEHASPAAPPPVLTRNAASFKPTEHLQVTWFGHSTLLVELDGKRILVDPIWSERASPFSWVGPTRFHAPVLPLGELPKVDAVLISHDHYDHLDFPTTVQLAERGTLFVVPLGVGAHLEHWGVSDERIVELDWWEEYSLDGLRLVATPARHFSGRFLHRDHTLWAGWAFIGQTQRAFYSGDTAMFPEFEEIGDRLGPFDVTMMESGAYNQLWADVHLGPEQAVRGHQMVRGELMIPVHWGTFDLALHSWTEPAERVLAAGKRCGVNVATPRIGETIVPGKTPVGERWWTETPWASADASPVASSALGAFDSDCASRIDLGLRQ